MTTLRNTLAIALTAATLSLGAIATSPSASAHGFFHGGGHFHRNFGRVGHGWGHHRFGNGWGGGHRCIWHSDCRRGGQNRWGYHWGGEHRWGYHWGGYRRVTEVGVGVVEAPRVVETPRCPEGTHLGYRGKYCWPNRQ